MKNKSKILMIFMTFVEFLLRSIYQRKDQEKIAKKLFFLPIFQYFKYSFIIKFNMANNSDSNILIKISLHVMMRANVNEQIVEIFREKAICK